jgi:hypothetical protein
VLKLEDALAPAASVAVQSANAALEETRHQHLEAKPPEGSRDTEGSEWVMSEVTRPGQRLQKANWTITIFDGKTMENHHF